MPISSLAATDTPVSRPLASSHRTTAGGPPPIDRTQRRASRPGLLVAGGAALVALGVSLLAPTVSALLVAIVLGVVAANGGLLPAVTRPGLDVASRRLLRLGIVLLGLHVSLTQIADLGVGVVAVAVAVVASGFATAELLGRRLGLRAGQRLLIGAGMSICGAAAVAAVEGVVRERAGGVVRERAGGVVRERAGGGDARHEEDVVTAVALVVVLGTAMIAVVPLVAGAVGMAQRPAGLWAGASIHEVAQVVAAGGIIGGAALQAAVVVKLTRVLLLAPVVALLGLRVRRDGPAGVGAVGRRPPLVPLFVVGFLGAVLVRTAGVLPTAALDAASLVQTLLLAAAMFALGTGVRAATLRRVGGRPVLLAAATTLVVALVGLAGILALA